MGSQAQGQIIFPAKGLADGLYIVQLQLDNESITKKVIKQ
jgi:hypothetical protein